MSILRGAKSRWVSNIYNKDACAKWFPLTEVLRTFAERMATPCSTKRGARPAKQYIKPYVLVELQA